MTAFRPIASVEALRTLYKSPVKIALDKETPRINDAYRALIEAAPFAALASVGPEGLDCSPRGDADNLVRVLDDHTIAMADRRGNNRLDTLENIVRDGRVALLFLIPGCEEALRINGRAIVTADATLLSDLAKDGVEPATAIIVTIETMYFQCARAIKRSGIWDSASMRERASLPSAGELLQSVIPDFEGDIYDRELPDRQAKSL